MIRFRNPGTQYTTQVQVFKELYKEYKDAPSFDLDASAAAYVLHVVPLVQFTSLKIR